MPELCPGFRRRASTWYPVSAPAAAPAAIAPKRPTPGSDFNESSDISEILYKSIVITWPGARCDVCVKIRVVEIGLGGKPRSKARQNALAVDLADSPRPPAPNTKVLGRSSAKGSIGRIEAGNGKVAGSRHSDINPIDDGRDSGESGNPRKRP